MDRVLLGKKDSTILHSAGVIAYTPIQGLPLLGIAEGQIANILLTDTQLDLYEVNDEIIFPPVAEGDEHLPQKRLISGISLNGGYVQINIGTGLIFPNGTYVNNSTVDSVLNHWNSNSLRVRVPKIEERKNQQDYGLWVSKPSSNVLDPYTAYSGNLGFDSSDSLLGSLRVLQTGTFQIQCKKTFMGKKGALEIGSDEQMRANADYTKLYPFELDTIDDFADYYASLPRNANVALYGFGQGEVPFTGNAIHHQYVQNVYCDYGTQTIEFNPPLPSHIKTPYISVFFAVGNSSGHFHPWYANVTCDDSDYEWQYANSQHCVHMDSAWFRGKWTFRERSFAPLGTDVNTQFPEFYDTLPGVYADVSEFRVEKGAGLKEPWVATPTIVDVPEGTRTHATGYMNEHEAAVMSKHREISYNLGNRDLNSPSSLWGGMMKSFAGLQGLTYFANNTHLQVDAFMTPTHTPTPFETEIVKERVTNDTDVSTTGFHPDAGSDYDPYGNIRVNVGHYDGVNERDYERVVNRAFANGFGMPYKEKLPRKFRTKYWDGSQTEYEWWPIGHANGHFTIAYATDSDDVKLEDNDRATLKAMLQAEATAMYEAGEIASPTVEFGTVGDPKEDDGRTMEMPYWSEDGFNNSTLRSHPYLAATYGDYHIIKEMGANTMHEATPFLTVVNKGTRFPNQLPDTEAKGYPPNSQYEPGDAFLKTRTFQGQPTGLDSFWNSFSNNTSQWVSSNTPYGEFYYADGGYAMDHSPYFNYGGTTQLYAAEKQSLRDGSGNKCVKLIPSDWNVQRQSFQKHNWNGGNPKAGVGTEGRRFGFGGAGSAEALGGEGEGVFDTYYGKYIVYDIEGGEIDG